MYINFGRIDIFIMLSLPICEHNLSHHLFKSLKYFISMLYFLGNRYCSCFKRGVLISCGFFFSVIVNGIIFLIYVSVCSLLIQRKATDFCIFMLCPVTSLIIYSYFLDFFGFSTKTTMSGTNRASFTSSFLNCVPFISLSWLIVLARNSSIMLCKSDKNKLPCFFPSLLEKAFNISPLNIILSVGFFVATVYQIEEVLTSSIFLRVFS